jgi:replicative DNA helicase
MLTLKKRKVETSLEQQIAIGMVVSTKFLQEIHSVYDSSYFRNSYLKKVSEWCFDYYESYEQAPCAEIKNIFETEQSRLLEEESQAINNLLIKLSDQYEGGSINEEYLLDRALLYFKERELELMVGNVQVHLSRGEVQEAEEQVSKFRRVQKEASGWIKPLDDNEVGEFFDRQDEEFFRFAGQLGEFMGPLDRGWLVGLAGGFKKGKTHLAREFGVMGMLSGLRVADFSLEMNKNQSKERFYRRLTASGDEEGRFLYPVFDCLLNQLGRCMRPERTNRIVLRNNENDLPDFDPNSPYKPCSACRHAHPDLYVPNIWYEELDRPGFEYHETSKRLAPFNRMYGHLLRMKIYPRFSANCSDIMRDLDILERTEGFLPDIIIVDYADILAPEDKREVGIDKEDKTWMALARLASERHALVVTPTQVTRDALDSYLLQEGHMSKWIGKLGHVDMMLTVNQSEEEKRRGLVRMGIIAHRHRDFDRAATVMLLQQLSLGQTNLDSQRGTLTDTIEEEEENGEG